MEQCDALLWSVAEQDNHPGIHAMHNASMHCESSGHMSSRYLAAEALPYSPRTPLVTLEAPGCELPRLPGWWRGA